MRYAAAFEDCIIVWILRNSSFSVIPGIRIPDQLRRTIFIEKFTRPLDHYPNCRTGMKIGRGFRKSMPPIKTELTFIIL